MKKTNGRVTSRDQRRAMAAACRDEKRMAEIARRLYIVAPTKFCRLALEGWEKVKP